MQKCLLQVALNELLVAAAVGAHKRAELLLGKGRESGMPGNLAQAVLRVAQQRVERQQQQRVAKVLPPQSELRCIH